MPAQQNPDTPPVREITKTEARQIARDWHSPRNMGLCEFQGTGRNYADALSEAEWELEHFQDEHHDNPAHERERLRALIAHLNQHGRFYLAGTTWPGGEIDSSATRHDTRRAAAECLIDWIEVDRCTCLPELDSTDSAGELCERCLAVEVIHGQLTDHDPIRVFYDGLVYVVVEPERD